MTKRILVLAALCSIASSSIARAQGCLAAHTSQPVLSALSAEAGSGSLRHRGLHGLTVEVDWRSFSSFRHFVGEKENVQRAILGNQIKNHQNIYEVSASYQLTPRWSVSAYVPVLQSTRNQKYPPTGIYDIAGIGDMVVGAQAWVLPEPAENGANVAFSLGLKLPTGLSNGMGTGTLSGVTKKYVADQSIQPGDGTWGFTLGTQAYKRTYFHTTAYFQGSWLFNPEDTNGVKTFRAKKGEGVMSATDQYLFRGGLSRHIPKVRGLAASFGGRMEGIPVRDAFGKSDGFRRPGYIISVDPGIQYSYRRSTLSINSPWAVERNRRASVTDLAAGTHGDAAFADYAVVVGLAHSF